MRSPILVAALAFALSPAAGAQEGGDEPAPAPETPPATEDAAPPPSEAPSPEQPAEPAQPAEASPTAAPAEGPTAAPAEGEGAAQTEQPPAAPGPDEASPPAALLPPTSLPPLAAPAAGEEPTAAEAEEPVAEAEPGTDQSAGPKLLVMELVDNGAGEAIVAGINQAVQQQAVRSHVGEVVTHEQLRVGLDANALQQMAGCDTENCLADFGRRVDAEIVLGGNVSKVGDDLLVTVVALEPGTGKTLGQQQRKMPGTVSDLYYYGARQLTALVLTGRTVDPTVPVRVTASVPGALVLVDGREVGPAPVTEKLDPGDHEIKVKAEDYTPWIVKVTVEEGSPLDVSATLEEKGGFPLWPIALGFAATGILFGGVGVTTGLLSLEQLNGYPPMLQLAGQFDPSKAYKSPGLHTGELSSQSDLILVLGILTDASFVLAGFTFLMATGLVVTDVVLWSLEE